MHPAGADDEVGAGRVRQDYGGEGGVVGGAGCVCGGGVLFFEGEEVVVGYWYGGLSCALEAVGGFATF